MKDNKLLKISDLNASQISVLISQALKIRKKLEKPSRSKVTVASSKKGPVGLVFLEPSTRTRMSFERACHLVGRTPMLITGKESSFEKGETLEDALLNLFQLGIEDFVIRSPETGGLEKLRVYKNLGILNGGDGVGEHPSQALLDYLTLVRFFTRKTSLGVKPLSGFRLGIVGDLRRSRVTRSWVELSSLVGIDLTLIAPPQWEPVGWGQGLRCENDLQAQLPKLDAVMALRVQKERMEDAKTDELSDELQKKFQLKARDLKDKQKFLHPGPVNWGVELHQELLKDPRSLILEQVKSGLAMRSALLASFK